MKAIHTSCLQGKYKHYFSPIVWCVIVTAWLMKKIHTINRKEPTNKHHAIINSFPKDIFAAVIASFY